MKVKHGEGGREEVEHSAPEEKSVVVFVGRSMGNLEA